MTSNSNFENETLELFSEFVTTQKTRQAEEHGELLYAGLTGSQAYHTEHPNEQPDVDIVAVYTPPADLLLSLPFVAPVPPPTRSNNNELARSYDWSLHTDEKLARMLLNGNPNGIEILFANDIYSSDSSSSSSSLSGDDHHQSLKDDDTSSSNRIRFRYPYYQCDSWPSLKNKRNEFLTIQVMENYYKYARSQMNEAIRKKDGGKPKSQVRKKLYHSIRVMNESIRLAQGLPPLVYLNDDHPVRNIILRIRTEEMSFAEGKSHFDQMHQEYKRLAPHCPLPSQIASDVAQFVNDWVLERRLNSARQILKS
eukprot:gb/GECH01005468.1/.p1 GENE.gb/GECH01005468.1/~~gb/GECH01005468.1/.p1  ORF type:complete len:310 (+),score=94.18 gb/GECH01005468.1/:1-930(+)